MPTLWFDLMNFVYEDSDWSDLELAEDSIPIEDDYSEDSTPELTQESDDGDFLSDKETVVCIGDEDPTIPNEVEHAYKKLENLKTGKSKKLNKYRWLLPPTTH